MNGIKKEELLTKEELLAIFSSFILILQNNKKIITFIDIEVIVGVNKQLFEFLKQSEDDKGIGEAFIKMV